jgi:deoxyadenosine kinase
MPFFLFSTSTESQEERDYQTYVSLFSNMSNFMKKPNIIVHLDVSPEESLRRIKLRDRDCESGITLEYLQGLHAAYEEFINDIARVIPVIKVNYSEFRTAEEMAEKIKAEYEQIANIRTVTFQTSSSGSSGVKSEVETVAEKLAVEASVSAEAGGTARETPVDLADNSV